MGFSPAKSLTMTIKGKFKRSPAILMNGVSIPHVSQARLVGVIIDEARSYVQHALFIGEKASNCFGKVSRVSTSTWGVKYRILRVLYIGTYVATVVYAAAVWYRRSSFYSVRSALLRTQRPALMLLTKAYRSTSTAALRVLAGMLPADLEVVRAGRIAVEGSKLTGKERKKLKREVIADVVTQWQERWDASQDGREL